MLGRAAMVSPSPVTGGETSVVSYFDPDTIRQRYRNIGIDVSRYYGGLRRVELRRCNDTGYRFFCPSSLAGEADFYDQMLADDATDYRSWSEDYQFASDRIEDGASVLDIGCGYGKFLSRIAGRTRAVGVDGNGKARDRCVANGLDVRPSIPNEQFDVVASFQVLEHVWDVRSFMSAAIAAVKPGGRFILAVPDNAPWSHHFDKYDTLNTPPHHVGLWDRASLFAMGAHFGLEAEEFAYLDVDRSIMVPAYLRAKLWAAVKSPIHHHSLGETMRIALLGAPALAATVASLALHGHTSRNTCVIVYRKAR